ncbi:TraR/DksA C4-type zinc finger protein [Roseospira visakhapatnamensis]|uniref:Phage/conjugal plasmid C-4 type zinc finger TraR family protein n=1 Tax=Roseospira visakhapatnamensis TaxID=390880 RepID=A0A7W6RG92_9PROT|nr:TraR/DksA C4-type zinc finger protein [Roseospira visakhapatnamensis]MBB4267780.1 phage/conjugal plasmid C-4 type zinc finger TraR family protein [Roseospira visakhapatnamensis]
MADLVDIAADRVEAEREAIVARRRAYPAPTAPTPATRCTSCGQPIPPARRQARPGATRCAGCQAAAEVRAARYRKTGVW